MKENDKKQNNKSKIIIVVIILSIIAIIGTSIFGLYKRDNNKLDNNNINTKYEKIDENKDFIYIHKGNTYEVNFNESKQVSFDYPIININTESVKKLNNNIQKQFNDLEEEYKKIGISDGSTCIKIDGINHCAEHIESLHYVTIQTLDYYQVLLYSFYNAMYASGDSDLKGYIISIKTGEVMNNKEIIELFGYDANKLLQEYNKYKQEEYKANDEVFENINDINKLSLIIHNDILIIIDYPLMGDGYNTLSFDGEKVQIYIDYDDPINVWW